MKKPIGKAGVPDKNPTITILQGDKNWDAVISFKEGALPIMRKKDVRDLFLTLFSVMQEHDIRISRDEADDIADAYCPCV